MSKYCTTEAQARHSKEKQHTKRGKILRIISIVLFMRYSPIHIIHYDFYYYEGTWSTEEQRQRAGERGENIFHQSRLLQVTNLLSAFSHTHFRSLLSDFHR